LDSGGRVGTNRATYNVYYNAGDIYKEFWSLRDNDLNHRGERALKAVEKKIDHNFVKRDWERDWQMTCEEAVNKLYEYLDHELDQTTVEQLDKHLDICKSCCDRFELEKRVKSLIQEKCIDQKAPQFLKDKIRSKLRFLE
jgi:mycothiol system anti-sigma-R factor